MNSIIQSVRKAIVVTLVALILGDAAYATHMPITIQESDGSPSVQNMLQLKVNNGKLTSLGNGTVQLDINGDITAASSFTDNRLIRADGTTGLQNSGITIDDSDNITGAVAFTATGTIQGATINGSTLTGDALTITGTTELTGAVTVTGNATISGTVQGATVNGSTLTGDALTITGTTGLTGATTMTGAATVTANFTVDTNTFFVDSSADNVGIGDLTPSSKLDVNGTIAMTGFKMTTGAQNGYVLTSDGSGIASWQATAGGGSPAGSDTYIQYNSGGSFGAEAAFAYNYSTDTMTVNGTTDIDIVSIEAGSAGAPTFRFQDDTDTGIYATGAGGNAAAFGIGFSTGGSNRMIIDANGYVGINGLTANERLDVNGNIAVSGKVLAGTGSAAAPAYSSLNDATTGLYGDNTGLGLSMGGTAKIFIDSMGNVGIGTTSPAQSLEIAGTTLATTILVNDGSAASPTYAFESATSSGFYNIGGNVGVSSGGSNAMFISSSGVGIGNTSPDMSAKLDVTGATYSNSVVVGDGSAAAPTYNFKNDTDTGLYLLNGDSLGVAVAGTKRMAVNGTGLTVSGLTTTSSFRLTTSPTAGYILSSDVNGTGTWADPSSLVTTEWTDGGYFIYPTDDSGVETLIIGGATVDGADIILGANGDATFNEQAASVDFRIEGDTDTELFFVDGSADKIGISTTTPNSTLEVAGSMSLPITSKTANYTATATDHTIICDATSGVFTITLPAASGIAGRIYVLKKTDSSSNIVTIDANASETIDGALTQLLNVQYKSLAIQSDGSNWHIL